jgi:type I restriction enzyme S subunit
MSRYQVYGEYKESGVEWLGSLPSHWDVKRLGHFFEERREKVSDKDYAALSVTMKGIVPQLETAAKTDAGDSRKLVLKDDFVINSRSDRKGASGISPYDGSVSLISIVMAPRNIYPEFAHHLLRSYPFQEEFYRYGKGIVADLWSTNSSELKNILLPEIPIVEQQAIANFLEHETAKIDTLIAKQQQLIKLLKEKRQAVISHAVTKGLNPNAPMRDSGVEWLGEVPEHWRIGKCGFYLSILSGFAFPSAGFSDDEVGTKLLRGINVGVSRLKWNETVYWKRKTGDALDIYEMKAGDLVIGMDRPLISEGIRVAKVKEGDLPCLLLQRVASLKTGNELNSDYLLAFLSSEMFSAYFSPDTTGVSVPHISPEQINNFEIAIPTIEEQEAIAVFLSSEISKFDRLIEEAEFANDLLQERRTALISAAVTGKIDVRDWQPASTSPPLEAAA